MKKMRFLLTMVLVATASMAFAKTDSTASFKVWGNCDMCKSRMEKAAKAAGAEKAVWNDESEMMTVEFNSKKTSSDKIQQKIASVGHDTEKYKSLENAYNALPGCCKYKREEVVEKKEHSHPH
jgi:mercuric ion binding protein